MSRNITIATAVIQTVASVLLAIAILRALFHGAGVVPIVVLVVILVVAGGVARAADPTGENA